MEEKSYGIEYISKREIRFISPIGIDNGYVNSYQGEKGSTMEYTGDGVSGNIEWIIDEGFWIAQIGVWFEDGSLIDYDGVFELPDQAIILLRSLGFIVEKEFEAD
jgi:hypothetical protein